MLQFQNALLGIVLVLVITVLCGCSGRPGEASPEKYARLEIHMSLAEVEDIMGGHGQTQTFEGLVLGVKRT